MMAEPLGRPTAQRRAELADQLDALVIGGGELIHDRDDLLAAKYRADAEETIERAPTRWFIEGVGPELEPRCPTLWHGVGVPGDLSGETAARVCRSLAGRAYVSVRDERSLARLVAAGAEGAISIVPDSGFLVPRLFPLPVLQRRRALHHMMGWLPVGDYVVVQGNRSILNQVGQLCSALHTVLDRHPGLSLVTLETGPGDGEAAFSTAVRAAMVGVCSMPEALVPEDVASVIEGARGWCRSRCRPASRRWRSSDRRSSPTWVVARTSPPLPSWCRRWQPASPTSPSCPPRCTKRWAYRATVGWCASCRPTSIATSTGWPR
ncbi:MAG: polysaccharide pyruvyl transferase family protein [Actinobacteria bacterium]|nr:polysaccharide pyruvyl transferase family protein [Acidimicrobiaceae bacterium]NMD26226.1 polysaccharide pyruvyl transferase family protein [Actinomycetota bacterium]